jgi:RHS repeat-associated protein
MTAYNLTPHQGAASAVTYNYGATPAAGKLSSMTVGGVATNYSYDDSGRLTSASTPTWSQSYIYDGFGNLVQKTATGAAAAQSGDLRPTFDSRKNKFTTDPLVPTTGYDVEGRMVTSAPLLAETYAYDAANKRIMQRGTLLAESGGYDTARVIFWLGGQRMGTYSWRYVSEQWQGLPPKEDFYIGGKRAEPSDRLGSNIQGRTLLPYGEELTSTPHGGTKFATYQRDFVGQDYADQRYYSVGWGRFYTADPYMASGGAAEPGSWNRYAYVGGDPVNYVDPTGEIRSLGGAGIPHWPIPFVIFGTLGRILGLGGNSMSGETFLWTYSLGTQVAAWGQKIESAQQQAEEDNPKRYIAGLKVIDDCYQKGGWFSALRRRQYQVVDQNGDPFGSGEVFVRELVVTVKGSLNANGTWLTDKDGSFYDFVGRGTGKDIIAYQRFTAALTSPDGYLPAVEIPVAVIEPGVGAGRFGVQGINMQDKTVWVNGSPGDTSDYCTKGPLYPRGFL